MRVSTIRARNWALWLGGALVLSVIAFAVANRWRAASPEAEWKAIGDATLANRWAEVEARLVHWLKAHTDDGNARMMLGTLLLGRGREKDARDALQQIPRGDAAWGRAQALIGEIAIRRRDAPEAERALRAAIAADPAALEPRRRLVYLLSLEQRSQDARAVLWEMYSLTNDPHLLADLVLAIWTGEADVRGIGPELEEFLNKTPEDAFLNRAWGLALMLNGRPAEALPCLELASRALTNDPVGRFALAECRHAQGISDSDVACLGAKPSDPAEESRWWLLRGRFQETWGKPSEVRANLEHAVAANPANREAHFRLGQWLAREGDAKGATEHQERAEALRRRELRLRREHERSKRTPFTPELGEELGRLCQDAGMLAEARAWYQQAIRIDPTRSTAQTLLAQIPAGKTSIPFALSHPTVASAWDADAQITPVAPTARAERATKTARLLDDTAVRIGVDYQYQCHAKGDLFIADTMGGGVLLLDYDGDGWQDIYFVNGCPLPEDAKRTDGPNRLLRNRGDGTFEDVTAASKTAGSGYGMGGAVGDFDADGFDDLFLTGLDRTILYHNRGDGTFENVTETAGVFSSRWTTAAGFGDLDGDGDLDLVAVTYVKCSPTETLKCVDQSGRPIHCSPGRFEAQVDQVFRNEGDGTFRDVSAEAGMDLPNGRGLGLAIADLDEDGKLDLFVANDASRNFLFHNAGSLRFDEIAESAGVAYDGSGRATASMGVVAEDLDGDGRMDLLHTNFINEACTLHRNVGGGIFTDATLASGLEAASRPKTGFGAVAFDLDNDRRLDLFLANGLVDDRPWANSPMAQTAQLFRGGESGRFRLADAETSAYLARLVVGRGVAAGDLDNDGRVDLVVVHRDVPAAVLHNETPGGHWVGFRLTGKTSSRTPVGARVTCRVGGRDTVRWLTSGTSYLAANDSRLWFGLGAAKTLERLEVRWPSGTTQQWTNLPVDRLFDLREGAEPHEVVLGGR